MSKIKHRSRKSVNAKRKGTTASGAHMPHSRDAVKGRAAKSAPLPRAVKTERGILSKLRQGYGFVKIETMSEDVFIPARYLNGAMNGDTVEVSVHMDSERPSRFEGKIESVLERALTEVIGTFEKIRNLGVIVPDDKRIGTEFFVQKKDLGGAKTGDKVAARITKYPAPNVGAEASVTEVIGAAGEAGTDLLALARSYGFKQDFPAAVSNAALIIDESVTAKDMRGRRDLRLETIFTIDGADSKDFDDAVSIKKLDNGSYLLGVHIADVTHYVTEDSKLDKEALHRGTSVYLPGLVISMLPERLSNGICSLNEGVDRLALSIDMEVDERGIVTAHEIYESVICSKARLIYDDVTALLSDEIASAAGKEPSSSSWDKLKAAEPDLRLMRELSQILINASELRGSIDFDLDESEITLDESGVPVHVGKRERGISNRMIEQFMILANETVAEECFHAKLPIIYRAHSKPDAEKIRLFGEFLSGFGIGLKGNPSGIRPAELARISRSIKGHRAEDMISTVMLRTMQKAGYEPDCIGHFGLALRYYCHFTSPIRRYPDLFTHRVIKESLHGALRTSRLKQLKDSAAKVAALSSKTEIDATEAEREADRKKMAEYMSGHIGEGYSAVISGVTNFGIFATLENTVEGLIGMSSLDDDYYEYDKENYRLIGRLSKKEMSLGDRIEVVVRDVNIEDAEIDLIPS